MGEPMDNLDAVMAAIGRLTDEGAPRLASRNVTVSTSGVVPGMERFLRECRAHLARPDTVFSLYTTVQVWGRVP